MSQITHGFRAVLSNPLVYSLFQTLMGAHSGRRFFVEQYVRPTAGMKVLDLGCGPAEILSYLPPVDYWGFDISEPYIARARKRYGGRGRFFCEELDEERLGGLPTFDIVLAIGLLHHLETPAAVHLMKLAARALRPGGRMVTIDPCIDPAQGRVARFLVLKDRGQNVRDRRGYEAIARSAFPHLRADVRHKAWIPYTHCLMDCVNDANGS